MSHFSIWYKFRLHFNVRYDYIMRSLRVSHATYRNQRVLRCCVVNVFCLWDISLCWFVWGLSYQVCESVSIKDRESVISEQQHNTLWPQFRSYILQYRKIQHHYRKSKTSQAWRDKREICLPICTIAFNDGTTTTYKDPKSSRASHGKRSPPTKCIPKTSNHIPRRSTK